MGSAQGFADVDPWLDGTLRFGGGYSTWSPPSSPVMAEVRQLKALLDVSRKRAFRAVRLLLAFCTGISAMFGTTHRTGQTVLDCHMGC